MAEELKLSGMSEELKCCPKCGHPRLQIQVLAWWLFDKGEPLCQGDRHIERPQGAYAICEECSYQWET